MRYSRALLILVTVVAIACAWGLLMDRVAPRLAICIAAEAAFAAPMSFLICYRTRDWWLEVRR